MGTWQDFCYFFPRLIELSLELETVVSLSDPEMLISRLGDDRTLTATQLDALHEVLRQWRQKVLRDDACVDAADRPETLLSCVVLAGLPLAAFLQDWLDAPEESAAAHLAHFIRFNGEDLQQGGVWSPFLDDEHSSFSAATERKAQASATVREWLRQPAVLQRLQELKGKLGSPPEDAHLMESIETALAFLAQGDE